MAATHTIEVNGKAFQVRIGWNAVRRIEEALGEPVQDVGVKMMAGRSGIRELGIIFWAGLETARLKERTRPNPWTIEEVGDLIDEAGSPAFFDQIYPKLMVAFSEAFPPAKLLAEGQKAAKKGGESARPRRAAAGTGKGSSTTPPSTDS
jgi:hypothetical protein